MRRLWLLFAQTVTIVLALYFVYSVVRPDGQVPVTLRQQQLGSSGTRTALLTEAPALPSPGSYRSAAGRAMPAVVNILTSKAVKRRHPLSRDPFFRKFFGDRDDEPDEQNSLGSGVIVSPEGYILTNNHVVEAADEIEVVLADSRKAKAKVVGVDPETDLAVIRIELDKLPVVTLGQVEQAKVGDVVLAIGNPFGVGQTVTMGIVSALGRSHLGINTFENYIQTDAAINPGNSGGALVDAGGNLVGINSAIYSRSGGSMGIGFAIPVSLARNVMEQIIQSGEVTRGWIGVEIQEVTIDLAESFSLPESRGTLIAGVLRGGPADRAGIKPGDILVAIDGRRLDNPQQMLEFVAAMSPGGRAAFQMLRGRKPLDLAVEIGRRPVPAQARPEVQQ